MTTQANSATTELCLCGRSLGFETCCQPIHRSGAGLGITAEALMRARYSAYVIGNEQFLIDSWHPDTRPAAIDFTPGIRWTGLTVIDTVNGGGLDSEGTVEFVAQFATADGPNQLHEVSSFVRQGGNWVYVDGKNGSSVKSDNQNRKVL